MTEQEMLLGAITGLVAGIGYLHKRLSDSFSSTTKRLNDKLDECEYKHQEANVKLIELAEQVGKLLGYKELHDNIIDKIDKMRK